MTVWLPGIFVSGIPDLLEPLAGLFSSVIVTAAADEQAIATDEVVAGVRKALGDDVAVEVATPVAQAVVDALHTVGEEDILVVTGSLYVVSEARDRLLGG